jgi:hypothetical protein
MGFTSTEMNAFRAGLKACTTAVVLALIASPAIAADKTYVADRYDVVIAAQPDGALIVTETIRFNFQGGPFEYVYRTVPARRTDGIVFISASMDDMTLARDEVSARRVEVGRRKNGRVRITWRFPKVSDATHTFTIRYQAMGVVVPEDDGRAVLAWRALPDERRYPIATATVRIEAPPGSTMERLPVLNGLPGVTVERAGNGVLVTAGNLSRRDRLELRAEYRSAVATPKPRWLERQERIAAAAPQYVQAAVIVAVVGFLVLGLLLVRDRRSTTGVVFEGDVLVAPPADRPAALAGALVRSGRTGFPDAVATLYELGARGVLQIRETSEKKWYRPHEFVVEVTGSASGLRPHEHALMIAAFGSAAAVGTTGKLSVLARRVQRRWSQFRKAVVAELHASGLIDADRESIQRRWMMIGFGLLVMMSLAIVLALLRVQAAGGWPMLIALAFGLQALAAFGVSALYSTLSEIGLAEARRWISFKRFLGDSSRDIGADPNQVERYLPYAIVFGLAGAWVKSLKKHGAASAVPAWFHASSRANADAAFIALLASSSGSGTGAGGAGAGAGGAAGGGGSGAG